MKRESNSPDAYPRPRKVIPGLKESILALCAALLAQPALAKESWIAEPDAWGGVLPRCQKIAQRLNEFLPQCAKDVVSTAPDFTPLDWRRIPASEHLELIAKLIRYRGSALGYKDLPPNSEVLRQLLGSVRIEVDSGVIEIEEAKVRLFDYFDEEHRVPVPDGPQTLVRLTRKAQSPSIAESCPSGARAAWSEAIFIVVDDLSGPDVRVAPSVVARYQEKSILAHDGIYFAASSAGLSPIFAPVSKDAPACFFRYIK